MMNILENLDNLKGESRFKDDGLEVILKGYKSESTIRIYDFEIRSEVGNNLDKVRPLVEHLNSSSNPIGKNWSVLEMSEHYAQIVSGVYGFEGYMITVTPDKLLFETYSLENRRKKIYADFISKHFELFFNELEGVLKCQKGKESILKLLQKK